MPNSHVAVVITRSIAAFESWLARLSNSTVAKPIFPEFEIAPAPVAYGLTTR